MRTSFAIMALIGASAAIRFESTDPEYYAATEQEVNLDSEILRRHHHHGQAVRPIAKRDAYDHDPDTVSQYDDMKQHFINPADKAAHIEKKAAYGAQRIHGDTRAQVIAGHRHHHSHHKHHTKKDAYDYDPHTTSEFDDASNINGGNPYTHAIADSVQGPSIQELETKIKDKLVAKKALKNKVEAAPLPRPGAEAREGFAGAITVDAARVPQYDQHGATKEQIQQQDEAEKAAETATKKADAETDKIADAAVAEEEKKAEKKEADAAPAKEGEAKEEVAPELAGAEKPAA